MIMKKLLRLTFLALVAMVCNTAMADEATFTKYQSDAYHLMSWLIVQYP